MKYSLFFACILISSLGFGQIESTHLNLKKSVALSGYDPISYFDGKPEKGSSNYSVKYKGAIYYFKNENHLTLFKNSPSNYEPEYGGWCAYAMGVDGSKVKIDPETFKVINGKLYLFYNFGFTNTLEPWNENEADLLNKADEYWSKMIKK